MVWLAVVGGLLALFVGFIWYLRRQIRLSATLPPGCMALLKEPLILTRVQLQYTLVSKYGDGEVLEWSEQPELPGFGAIVLVEGRKIRLTCEPSSKISATDRIGTSLFDEQVRQALPHATSSLMVEWLVEEDRERQEEDFRFLGALLRLLAGNQMLATLMRV